MSLTYYSNRHQSHLDPPFVRRATPSPSQQVRLNVLTVLVFAALLTIIACGGLS